MSSPTSKVQGPKSASSDTQAAGHNLQGAVADVGHWTLDLGLRVSDLRKSFVSPHGERVEVLRGISFSAIAGEAIAVVGSSGAGKSTLLHLLGGLEAADHGSITAGDFAVQDASTATLAQFRNQHVGFIFQFHHLLPDLTAAENVSLPLRIRRTRPGEAMQRAKSLLESVGLDGRVSDSIVGHLSGGEQQRVAVCRSLITRPELVLADEPTGNLDTASGDEITRILVSYAKTNRALLMVATHNLALAKNCDRTLLLANGRLFSPIC